MRRATWSTRLPPLRSSRDLSGKDPTYDAGFAVAGAGGNPEATGLLERSEHRNQPRLGSARTE
jgi:hypothetical protein